jgi:hypothetical protein
MQITIGEKIGPYVNYKETRQGESRWPAGPVKAEAPVAWLSQLSALGTTKPRASLVPPRPAMPVRRASQLIKEG